MSEGTKEYVNIIIVLIVVFVGILIINKFI